MEPKTFNRFTNYLLELLNRLSCKWGHHTWSWSLLPGDNIDIDETPPDRATCLYCNKGYKETDKQ